MKRRSLFALPLLVLMAAPLAHAQVLDFVSDERSVSYHIAFSSPCPLDTTYAQIPSAPFAAFNVTKVGQFGLSCGHDGSVILKQNSLIRSDSIGVYEYVYSGIGGDGVLHCRANSDARVRFRVPEGTRYYFDCWAYGAHRGGTIRLDIALTGPEPSPLEIESLHVAIDRTDPAENGGTQQRRGTLAVGTYSLDVHAWAEASTAWANGTVWAFFTLQAPTAVETRTWDRVKAMYR